MARKKAASAPPPQALPEPPSDKGVGSVSPGRGDLAALRLERLAIAQAWPVKAEDKEASLARMRAIQGNEKAGWRAHLAAARTCVAMTGQNLAAIDTAIKARQSEDFDERLRALEQAGVEVMQQPRIAIPSTDVRPWEDHDHEIPDDPS